MGERERARERERGWVREREREKERREDKEALCVCMDSVNAFDSKHWYEPVVGQDGDVILIPTHQTLSHL